jgi:hypothetical protein
MIFPKRSFQRVGRLIFLVSGVLVFFVVAFIRAVAGFPAIAGVPAIDGVFDVASFPGVPMLL